MPDPGPQTEKEAPAPTAQAFRRLTEMVERLAAQPVRKAEPQVLRIRRSQLLSAVLGSMGLVIFALGIERAVDDIPFLSSAVGLVVIGLLLMAVSGTLLRKLS